MSQDMGTTLKHRPGDATGEDANKICFVITPIGADGSDTRRRTEGLIDEVIEPVMATRSLQVIVAHRISVAGSITRQVLEHLRSARLVVANLTGLNPNVMYELGIRHATFGPVLSVAEDGTPLPFDVADQRTIFYRDDMAGAYRLKADLEAAVDAILEGTAVDNPYLQVVQRNAAVKEPWIGKEEYILRQLEDLTHAVNSIASTQHGTANGSAYLHLFRTGTATEFLALKGALQQFLPARLVHETIEKTVYRLDPPLPEDTINILVETAILQTDLREVSWKVE